MQPMELRRIRRDEGMGYREARLRALELAPDAYEATYEDSLALPESEWHDIVAEASEAMENAIFVIDRGGGAIGGTVFVRVNETPPHDTYIGAMWVDPDLRGGPAAEELLAAAEQFAAACGSESCELWVEEDNAPARRLYAACGYRETGVSLPGRRGVASQLLQKFLGSGGR